MLGGVREIDTCNKQACIPTKVQRLTVQLCCTLPDPCLIGGVLGIDGLSFLKGSLGALILFKIEQSYSAAGTIVSQCYLELLCIEHQRPAICCDAQATLTPFYGSAFLLLALARLPFRHLQRRLDSFLA